jgi:hypothetical protein
VLLTTACRPYGVRTRDAEALGMQMELLNNQITREQGVHSPRANFWTFPLYFLAENISVPATVLDFPSWRDFTRELRRNYTHVAISFIQTNVLKVKRMAEYIRRHYPRVKILLGGYGAGLPNLDRLVPHDDVCHGEGISWLRRYFGEDPDRPVRHPVMHGVVQKHLYGFRGRNDDSAVLFPGLGCTNGCFFCSTSNKFGRRYIPILPTGRDVFNACRAAEAELGVREFAIIDENFLKEPERARELLRLMEAEGRTYNFWIFSSAESLAALGVEFLVRLGVCAVWIGIETSADVFQKTQDIDTRALVRSLQDHGISVISSSILFMEHHDGTSLREDIDWAISYGTDMHQFMQLTPLPGTPLYEQYRAQGRLIEGFPYPKMSGQNELNFHHPHFDPAEARRLTQEAFRRKYHADGPAVANMARTALRGLSRAETDLRARREQHLAWNPDTLRYEHADGVPDDPFLEQRVAMLRRRAEEFRPALRAAWAFAPNRRTRKACRKLIDAYAATMGPPRPIERAASSLLVVTASLEHVRHRLARLCGREDLVRQPPSRRIEYRTNGHENLAATAPTTP